jgi:hypothetical protein
MAFKIRAFAQRNEEGPVGYWYAQTYDFKEYLGLRRNQKWPKEPLGPVEVPTNKGPTSMFLYASGFPKERKGARKHRCYVDCPTCGVEVPAGRTHQHKCKEG